MIEVNISRVEVDPNKLIQKVESLLDDDTMMKIQEVFADVIDPWTPYLTGKLSGATQPTVYISAQGVTYTVPYAREKYYGEVYHHEVHPNASPHWDEVAMETEMDAFKEHVKQILIARAKELYG